MTPVVDVARLVRIIQQLKMKFVNHLSTPRNSQISSQIQTAKQFTWLELKIIHMRKRLIDTATPKKVRNKLTYTPKALIDFPKNTNRIKSN